MKKRQKNQSAIFYKKKPVTKDEGKRDNATLFSLTNNFVISGLTQDLANL